MAAPCIPGRIALPERRRTLPVFDMRSGPGCPVQLPPKFRVFKESPVGEGLMSLHWTFYAAWVLSFALVVVAFTSLWFR